MRVFLAIISIIIIILPIGQVLRYKGPNNYHLRLSKKWILGIVLAEAILLLLAWLDFVSISEAVNTADDFYWHNMFVYWRGMLPSSPLVAIFDSKLPALPLLIILYITALLVDYVILLFTSFLKKILME